MPDYSETEIKLARHPHELFLVNLITNHILVFVALLGMASHNPEPLVLVPLISVSILGYTIWRARKSRQRDSWFVMCHWQLAARRSRLFVIMLGFLMMAMVTAYSAYTWGGMMKEMAWALVGGLGMLPTLVTVLLLILLESDALHQARSGRMPKWLSSRYPQTGSV